MAVPSHQTLDWPVSRTLISPTSSSNTQNGKKPSPSHRMAIFRNPTNVGTVQVEPSVVSNCNHFRSSVAIPHASWAGRKCRLFDCVPQCSRSPILRKATFRLDFTGVSLSLAAEHPRNQTDSMPFRVSGCLPYLEACRSRRTCILPNAVPI